MKNRLYPILDLDFSGEGTAARIARELADAGCSMIQVRAKNASGAQFYRFALSIVEAAGDSCRVLINDRLDIALATGADGVHLGENDIPVAKARRLTGDGFIVGATARTPDTALAAQRDGADYIGAGAVFPTGRKDNTVLIGLEGIRSIVRAVRIPVFAIAGVSAANCTQVIATGAWGASCISAVAGADNPSGAWLAMENDMNEAAGRPDR